MRKLWFVCLFFYSTHGRTQSADPGRYQDLISDAVFHKTFVDVRPLCFSYYRDAAQAALSAAGSDSTRDPELTDADVKAYQSLIDHVPAPDTTAWKDDELRDCAIVRSGNQVDRKYALTKFQPVNKNDKRYYTGLIKSFNQLPSSRQWLSSFSRPVLDSSGTYAILVGKSDGKNFGCYFYKWNGLKWVESFDVATRD